MADGASGVKQFTDEMEQAAGDVVKDVKDSVGQTLEQGGQSLAGTQLTPQQIQQRQLEDQQKLTEARRKIKWYKDLAVAQKAEWEKQKQKELQRQQIEIQQKQAKKVEKIQIQQTSKRPGQPLTEEIARTQVERSKGRGIGG